MQQRTKLQICLVCNFLLLLVVSILMYIFESNSNYCRFGPQNNLIVINVKINTYTRYYILLGIVAFIKASKVLIEELGMPVLGFSIYNPDKKVITEFRKNELQFYACSMYLISNLRYIFEIMLTISQIDIAIYSVIISELTGIITIRMLLNEKEFKTSDDIEERINLI